MRPLRYKVGDTVWVRSLIGFDVRKGVIVSRSHPFTPWSYVVRLVDTGVVHVVSRHAIYKRVTS